MTPSPLRGTHKHQVLQRVAAEQESAAEAKKKQQEKEKQVKE